LAGAPPLMGAALSSEEARVIEILLEPTERDTLIRKLSMPISTASIVLMQMEIAGHIIEENGVYRKK
ncbi:MAG: hypothetical protein WDZ56_01735, partial [Candidatus Paceibacterota bacterium]